VTGALGKRVATAAVLIAVTVALVLAGDTTWVALALALLVLAGAWEWAGLMRLERRGAKGLYVLSFLPWLVLGYAAARGGLGPSAALVLVAAGLLWPALALCGVARVARGRPLEVPGALAAGLGWAALVPAWTAIVVLHGSAERGPFMLLFLLCLVWACDSGAYFAGRRYGRRRLAPRVSPGKTWAGVAGGLGAAAATAVAAGLGLDLEFGVMMPFVVLCLATALVSIVGDLAESLLKRRAGVKDSGRLLPGHGGVLDRVDALIAAAPFFVLGLEGMRAVT